VASSFSWADPGTEASFGRFRVAVSAAVAGLVLAFMTFPSDQKSEEHVESAESGAQQQNL
jgi:hypothetical protein